ncbi:MAG: FIST N-terminal domain-containing protein [Planctomycetota bacterium]
MTSNHYASSLSIGRNLARTVEDAAGQLRTKISEPLDLLVVFAAGYRQEELDRELPRVADLVSCRNIVGTTCEGVISGSLELEAEPALTMWAASFSDTDVVATHLDFHAGPDGGGFVGWPDELTGEWPDNSCIMLLAEPFGFPADGLIERINEDRPGIPIVGGMASGAAVPGHARLLFGDNVINKGGLLVRFSPCELPADTATPGAQTKESSSLHSGPVFQTIVSQGCRPIGEKMVITAAERNVIKTLGGELALDKLKKLFATLPTREQRTIQHVLNIGRVINEYQDSFDYGDFLIRNVIGIDQETGFLTVGDYMKPGQTVQFHVRDPMAASAELNSMLTSRELKEPAAALLFSCNGRGSHMFPEPHHDARAVRGTLGEIPLAGFFAGGEIGPVGGRNFMHGYTASVAMFR